MICTDCKQEKTCRFDMTDTAYGPRAVPVCRECYEKTTREVAAEFRKFKLGRAPKRTAFDKMQECK